ncbi:hypothetical protein MFMK1_001603 [Metallumcola ferriviriculae]|uniref:Uncharacterized protein n=1 Tax=Metallumcola ferriviriculae TaxID=3039180 RepID=A0AAU0UN40_9FIRM|nr:hypothetical protein MFMK1_001603 [Desulfitibacteraceae bacterium MK1]
MRPYKYLVLWLSLLFSVFLIAALIIAPRGSSGTDDMAANFAVQLGASAGKPILAIGGAGELFIFTFGGFVSGFLIYHYWHKAFGRREQD